MEFSQSEAEQIEFLKEKGMTINENPDKEACVWQLPVYMISSLIPMAQI